MLKEHSLESAQQELCVFNARRKFRAGVQLVSPTGVHTTPSLAACTIGHGAD